MKVIHTSENHSFWNQLFSRKSIDKLISGSEAPGHRLQKTLDPWSLAALGIGALTGMISSLLVFQYGQALIWHAMSRDDLFPKFFSAIHPKFRTPHLSTWIAGFAVGIPGGIFAISDAGDLSNIGTLFAFVLVSLGVIVLRRTQPDRPRLFEVPLVPWFPLISTALCGGLMMGLAVITWVRFVVWLVLGLLIYLFYSRHRSEFAKKA
ncbi:MAG: amino acid permease [Acidobacteriia bacterium]|nr:amino acid permease [Terriglobia bacterium]